MITPRQAPAAPKATLAATPPGASFATRSATVSPPLSASLSTTLSAALLAALLSACGGGGGDTTVGAGQAVVPPTTSTPPTSVPQQPGAPTLSGNVASDGFTWINYRRAQLGLSTLTRNANVDLAAQGHSDYLRLNNTVTHEQTQGKPGFTGVTLKDRLIAANYSLSGSYAIGEVISAAGNNSGFYQAEELITAIYHRFVIFEPVFKEIGTGAATANGGYTYFTADFTAVNGYTNSGIGSGNMITYPFNGQTAVPTNFFSDSESPDPVPGQNEVGYPISVHTDTNNSGSEVVVQSFTVAPRGGTALNVRLLSHANEQETTSSAAAIIPLAPLRNATTYDVSFSGRIAGVPTTRNWSFTTK
jgi:uncharacterized protein YkwD